MTDSEDLNPSDPFYLLLAAHDEARQGQAHPREPQEAHVPAAMRARWHDAVRCLDLLARCRQPRTSPEDPLLFRVGRYVPIRELGRGSFGIVYLADDPLLRRQVALKVPHPEVLLSREMRQRFLREARTAALLDHPNLVAIHEAGETGSLSYIASAYCPGPTLAAWLRAQTQPADFQMAARLVADLADAVQHAHSRGIIHRDLKPANILLQVTSDEGQVAREPSPSLATVIPKITDFGLAKLLDGEATLTNGGALLGTPAYMAPEQAAMQTRLIGTHTDIHALGVILYQLFTGRLPFGADTVPEILEQVRTQEPESPSRLRPDLPRPLQTICLKCLEKQPERRYASAADLADDLRRYLAGEPIRGQAISTTEQLLRWVKRRPTTAALTSALLLFLLILPVALLWHTRQLHSANTLAEEHRHTAEHHAEQARRYLYAADMRLALQAFQTGDVLAIPDLLDRHVPAPGAEFDRRNFEWWYLRRHAWKRQPAWHLGYRVVDWFQLSATPEGDALVLAGCLAEGVIPRVWILDATTGSFRLKASIGHHPDMPRACATALSPDGKIVAVQSADRRHLVCYDVRTGRERRRWLLTQAPFGMTIGPDNRSLILAGVGPLEVWDLESGMRSRTWPDSAAARRVELLACTPDGRTLITACKNRLTWWEYATGQQLRSRTVEQDVARLVISGSGRRLAVVMKSGQRIQFGDIHGREFRRQDLSVSTSPHSVVLADEVLSFGDREGMVRRVELRDGRLLGFLHWQVGPIEALARRGDELLALTEDGRINRVPGVVEQTAALWRPALEAGTRNVFAVDAAGRLLAVACLDGAVRLLDTTTGKLLATVPGGSHPVRDIALSPRGDLLALCEDSGDPVRFYETRTGADRGTFGGPGGVTHLSCSSGGVFLMLTGEDLWRIKPGTEPQQIRLGGLPVGAQPALSADGKTLAAGTADGKVFVWALAPAERDQTAPPVPRQPRTAAQLPARPDSLSLSADGRILAAACADGKILVGPIDDQKGPRLLENLVAAGERRVQLSADGKTLFVVGGQIDICDVDSGTLRLHLDPPVGQGWYQCLPFPTGTGMATAAVNRAVYWWDLKAARCQVAQLPPAQPLHSIVATRDGKEFFTAGTMEDHVVARHWQRPLGTGSPIQADTLALHALAGTIQRWSAEGTQKPTTLAGPSTMAPVERLALAADDRFLAGGCRDGSVWVWELDAQRCGRLRRRLFASPAAERFARSVEAVRLAFPVRPHYPEGVRDLVFAGAGRALVTLSTRGRITLWDAEAGVVRRVLQEETAGVEFLAVSPDGKTLASGCGGEVSLWNLESPSPTAVTVLGRPGQPLNLCGTFSPDGASLVCGNRDHVLRRWDLITQGESPSLVGHLDAVKAVAFTPDGRTLASGSGDRTIRLWNVASGQGVGSLLGHHGPVHALCFTASGELLLSGGSAWPQHGELFAWPATRQTPP